MFYNPKYCCNCGEKIERPNPSITDSRRFCDVCKHDFVLQRSAPKVLGLLLAVCGVFGIGSFWRGAEKPLNAARQISPNNSNAGKNAVKNASSISPNSNAAAANAPRNAPSPPDSANRLPAKQTASTAAHEAVYFCGAPTKKGTPCSRRVRGGGRCWQHKGQAALLPPEKLLAGG
ncbi:MAG TPA: hypothetical protein VIL74_06955 [Pyrinomonadaceae bacterium]|jgi:hypothetical protein